MAVTPHMILLLIGAILMFVSAFVSPAAIDLFKLAWGFVVLAFVFG